MNAFDATGRSGTDSDSVLNRAGGFTLLEMLVSMAIFSLLAGTAYAGLRISARTVEAGELRIAAAEQQRVGVAFVERYLSQAQPVATRSASTNNRWQVYFDGSGEQVTFLTEMPTHLGYGGLYKMTLAFEGSGDSGRLVVRRELFGADSAQESDRSVFTSRTLLGSLSDGGFQYFGIVKDAEEPEWNANWEGEESMPLAVRVSIEPSSGLWPPFSVPLRVTGVRRVTADGEGEEGEEGGEGEEGADEELDEASPDGTRSEPDS